MNGIARQQGVGTCRHQSEKNLVRLYSTPYCIFYLVDPEGFNFASV